MKSARLSCSKKFIVKQLSPTEVKFWSLFWLQTQLKEFIRFCLFLTFFLECSLSVSRNNFDFLLKSSFFYKKVKHTRGVLYTILSLWFHFVWRCKFVVPTIKAVWFVSFSLIIDFLLQSSFSWGECKFILYICEIASPLTCSYCSLK